MSITDVIAPVSAAVLFGVGVFGSGWLRIIKETNALLREQNNELKIANKELLTKHNENLAQLASLQGQIDVLKSIPLVNIDSTLKEISKFNKTLAESNQQILNSLERSAAVLAENTKNAATAVKEVKSDLKDHQ